MELNQWDYLIVTASNAAQAEAYESQLRVRRSLGLLSDVGEVLVVADPGGRRVGSGGSTLYCLIEVLKRQLGGRLRGSGPDIWEGVLRGLRILVVHAGGDSRRLPAYGPCGKIFIPVPGESDTVVFLSLFDRQLATYLALPEPDGGGGQVVITSGDVLLRFDASEVRFAGEGVTGLACHAGPDQASRHGVFCGGGDSKVRLYLQKPSIVQQREKGAIDAYGHACLDIGVMSFDAGTAAKMLGVFGARVSKDGELAPAGKMGRTVVDLGLDFYREICCAMGSEASLDSYTESVVRSGSRWDREKLVRLFEAFSGVAFSMHLVKHCDFLDFGANRSIISSGRRLLQEDRGVSRLQTFLDINNSISEGGSVQGSASWVEGCRIGSALSLGGENMVVGVDIDGPVSLGARSCVDVIKGRDLAGEEVWFVRCYGLDDGFKATVEQGCTFCGTRVVEWLEAVGSGPEDVWGPEVGAADRSLWNARLFPAVKRHGEYRRWLWMLDVSKGRTEEFEEWRSADRYSLEQILGMADQSDFYVRRSRIRAEVIRGSLRRMFRPTSGFSAAELAYLLEKTDDLRGWVSEIIVEAYRYFGSGEVHGTAALVFPRIMHTLGTALIRLYRDRDVALWKVLGDLRSELGAAERDWLSGLGLYPDPDISVVEWAGRAQEAAFEGLEKTIVSSGLEVGASPRSVLRGDEIVWARAPARLDVGGGWTDTPPYSLEWGGCVVNAAVNLNGQPPIQAYMRVIDERVIRVGSIDQGARVEIRDVSELLDYREATSSFGLAKAALVLSGLLACKEGKARRPNLERVLERFGGGIELTTLAAIPKGSGLGTSSIMGAVIVAAIARVQGKELSQRELFHSVLRLEQALTTGGGWQDQIGGAVDGVKMISTEAGLVPDARIHYVPADILDPKANGRRSLLYYTGVTRLAKDILHQVVGRYLDRDRATVSTLRRIRLVAREVMESFVCKDIEKFGRLVDVAWRLNKQLDPNSSNEEIESLFARVKPFVYGAKLLGAGGGGFMLMICRSSQDARRVREMLEREPPNEKARFFDFDVSNEGLTVTVC